jgi:hypothetical protein
MSLDHLVALLSQVLAQVLSDETVRAGHQDAHAIALSP